MGAETVTNQEMKMEKALKRIADWNELELSVRVDMGSNRVREYYRNIAKQALKQEAGK